MIHGLAGIHPDVQIQAGSTEQSNLRTWRLAQDGFKARKKAEFYNSVFHELIQEWTETQLRSRDTEPTSKGDHIRVQFNPLGSSHYLQAYKQYVTQKAQTLFGEAILATDEFNTLLETIDDNREKILQRLTVDMGIHLMKAPSSVIGHSNTA